QALEGFPQPLEVVGQAQRRRTRHGQLVAFEETVAVQVAAAEAAAHVVAEFGQADAAVEIQVHARQVFLRTLRQAVRVRLPGQGQQRHRQAAAPRAPAHPAGATGARRGAPGRMMSTMPRILPGLLALCLVPPLGAACPQLVVEPYDPGIAGAAAEPSLANAGEEFLLTWQARLEG